MINAATANDIAEVVNAGGYPANVPSTERQGNNLLDEANLSVVFAAMRGEMTTYIVISNYPKNVVNNCITTLEGLGFTISRNRERFYKEIVINWED